MSKTLTKTLCAHQNNQNNNKLILKNEYELELNLVFTRQDGSPLPKSSLFNAFERINKRAGLKNLPIHSLRHTHAVLQLESGARMKYIQQRLGHKSMKITSDTYSHISVKIEEDAMESYEKHTAKIFE